MAEHDWLERLHSLHDARTMHTFISRIKGGKVMTLQIETVHGKRGESDHKHSAEASQELLKILADNIKEYSILTLDSNGRVTTWTPAAERLKGYPADEIIGKHFSIFYTKEDFESGKCERELEIATREGRFEDEGWRVRKDGTRFWANVVITPLRDANGGLRGFGKITRDMTDPVRAK
jgi:PAS domain S-box-containing protein